MQNKAQYLTLLTSPDLRIKSSTSSDFVIRIYGDKAIATAEGKAKESYKSEEFNNLYRYTDVCIKRNGKWKVINTQITALP